MQCRGCRTAPLGVGGEGETEAEESSHRIPMCTYVGLYDTSASFSTSFWYPFAAPHLRARCSPDNFIGAAAAAAVASNPAVYCVRTNGNTFLTWTTYSSGGKAWQQGQGPPYRETERKPWLCITSVQHAHDAHLPYVQLFTRVRTAEYRPRNTNRWQGGARRKPCSTHPRATVRTCVQANSSAGNAVLARACWPSIPHQGIRRNVYSHRTGPLHCPMPLRALPYVWLGHMLTSIPTACPHRILYIHTHHDATQP